MKKLLILALVVVAVFAAEGYKVTNKIKIGGTGGWEDPITSRPVRLVINSSNDAHAVLVDCVDNPIRLLPLERVLARFLNVAPLEALLDPGEAGFAGQRQVARRGGAAPQEDMHRRVG